MPSNVPACDATLDFLQAKCAFLFVLHATSAWRVALALSVAPVALGVVAWLPMFWGVVQTLFAQIFAGGIGIDVSGIIATWRTRMFLAHLSRVPHRGLPWGHGELPTEVCHSYEYVVLVPCYSVA